MRGRPLIGVTRLRGLLSYHEGQSLQRAMLDRRKAGAAPDTLLLLEHQPVFTLGRLQESASNLLASSEELAAAGASVYQSDRGGNITFHGPGQLVAYPILDLRGHTASARWYISALEEAMIGTAARFGVSARAAARAKPAYGSMTESLARLEFVSRDSSRHMAWRSMPIPISISSR